MKICYKCKKKQKEKNFFKSKTSLYGLHNWCKDCYRIWQKQYLIKYRKKLKIYRKKYWKKNKEVLINKRIQRQYGITQLEYNNIFKKQNKKCAICKSSFNKRKLDIDHNHKTGKVRGLLCSGCNIILGNAKDNIQILQNAIKYLKINKYHANYEWRL